MSISFSTLSEAAKTLYDQGQQKVLNAMAGQGGPGGKSPGEIMQLLQDANCLSNAGQAAYNHLKATSDRIGRMG